ncbi:MAG: glycosyltransferase [Lautropia sp.]|nr:glycosyltransferase [Lautropia sp.]
MPRSDNHASTLATSLKSRPTSRTEPTSRRLVKAIVLAALLAILNFLIWDRINPLVDAPSFYGKINGLAYNSAQRWDNPLDGKVAKATSIERDLKLLHQYTSRIRTYSSSDVTDIPWLAEKQGLHLTAGVWVSRDDKKNAEEFDWIDKAVRETSSIERIIVGNEQVLHAGQTPAELIQKIREVKRLTRKPVSTAEPWHVWIRYPELAANVDFITVHLLPYWEGLPVQQALDYTFGRLRQVQERFPDKKVIIGEVGWPSQGDRRDASRASPASQAEFIRGFLVRAAAMDLDYFLMEGIDQPWKIELEGRAGPYWGYLDAYRQPKYSLTAPIERDPGWRTKAASASVVGMLAMFWFMFNFSTLRLPSRIAFGVVLQTVISLFVWLVALPFDYYMRPIDWTFLVILVPSLLAMATILLTNFFEFVEMFWSGNLRKVYRPRPLAPGAREPKVSIHLACCNEQPDMVIATIKSLVELDYTNYEVLVLDNNTKDEKLWKPVEAYMATLPDNFRFFHLENWPGFKAGALNYGLSQTAPDAEIVAVVDADYVVVRRWLRDLVSYFEDPKTGVVQSPQAHRGWSRHTFRRMMNFEYDGFFRIGMHHRNERNAIMQHGTMIMVRAEALRKHGQWSEWCICEDAELALRLMDAGYELRYVDVVMGRGLTPDTFFAFKKQRKRWAQGAMQILKGQGQMLFGSSNLTNAQRYHFVTGWFSWLGDALHLVFALAAIAWSIGIIAAPHLFSLPILLFMIPLIAFFTFKVLMGPLLYMRRVRCSQKDVWGSALAGMALSHGIAQGVFAGLWNKSAVFEVTEKGGGAGTLASEVKAESSVPGASPAQSGAGQQTDAGTPAEAPRPEAAAAPARPKKKPAGMAWGGVREEALLLIGLLVATVGIAMTRLPNHLESAMWMVVLVLQAVPYMAAVACAMLSASPAAHLQKKTPRPALTTDGTAGDDGQLAKA